MRERRIKALADCNKEPTAHSPSNCNTLRPLGLDDNIVAKEKLSFASRTVKSCGATVGSKGAEFPPPLHCPHCPHCPHYPVRTVSYMPESFNRSFHAVKSIAFTVPIGVRTCNSGSRSEVECAPD